MSIVVDLPAPFGPRRATVSPGATARSTPRTAGSLPYNISHSAHGDRRCRVSKLFDTHEAHVEGMGPAQVVRSVKTYP